MGKKDKIYDRHHLVGQEYREYFHINDERNIKIMRQTQHRGLHALMKNLNTPKDQLAFMKELFNSILSETSKELLTNLLQQTDQEFYADGLLK